MITFKQFILEVFLDTSISKNSRFDSHVGKDLSNLKVMHHPHSKMRNGDQVHHYHNHSTGNTNYLVTDKTNKVKAHLTLKQKEGWKSHNVESSNAKPGFGMHKLYHHLITKHDHIITSDHQSPGGLHIWHKLSRMPGISVHGHDTRNDTHHAIEIDKRNPDDTHTSSDYFSGNKEIPEKIKNKKLRASDRNHRLKDHEDVMKTYSMSLVAHKTIK